mmetsp:Transcript_19134/g.53268  ORF Transcript_19134/g.53268 Transcript_19134/m.53268 type:complete len:446 (+) Transcript_19134:666-2003(+)
MTETNSAFLSASVSNINANANTNANPNHRRRRGKPQQNQTQAPNSNGSNGSRNNNNNNNNTSPGHVHNHYYDDSDDDDKGHRYGEDRIFEGSCSFGQFVMNPCLCLFNTAMSCHRRWRVRRRSEKLRVLLLCLLGSAAVVSLFSADSGFEFEFRSNSNFNFNSNINSNFNFNFNPQKRSLWSVSVPSFSGRTVDQIPIAIPIFDNAHRSEDIGGWTKHRRFFHPTKNMSSSKSSNRPDFGGLDLIEKRESGEDAQLDPSDRKERMLFAASLHSPRILSSERVIHPEDGKRAEEYWEKLYDKDFHVHTYDMHPEELEDRDEKCWFTSWAKKYYPDCVRCLALRCCVVPLRCVVVSEWSGMKMSVALRNMTIRAASSWLDWFWCLQFFLLLLPMSISLSISLSMSLPLPLLFVFFVGMALIEFVSRIYIVPRLRCRTRQDSRLRSSV